MSNRIVPPVLTNRSGSITLGGTAQTLAEANLNRGYLFILNLHATADLWIDFNTTAVQLQPSLRIQAGQSFVMEGTWITTDSISIIGGTTGQTFCCKEG